MRVLFILSLLLLDAQNIYAQSCDVEDGESSPFLNICNMSAKEFCSKVKLSRYLTTPNFETWLRQLSTSIDKQKSIYAAGNSKPSDMPKMANIQTYETEEDVLVAAYKNWMETFEKDYIEPLLNRVKKIQSQAIDQLQFDNETKSSMKNSMQSAQYLGMSKINNAYNDWMKKYQGNFIEHKRAQFNKNILFHFQSKQIGGSTHYRHLTPGVPIDVRHLTKKLLEYEDDFKEDLGSFYGTFEHPPTKDYCEELSKSIDDNKRYSSEDLLEKLTDGRKIEKKEIFLEEMSRKAKFEKNEEGGSSENILLKKLNHNQKEIQRLTDLLIVTAKSQKFSLSSAEKKVITNEKFERKKRYCEVRNQLRKIPEGKIAFNELARITFEKEVWLGACGSAGLIGNALYWGYSSREFIESDDQNATIDQFGPDPNGGPHFVRKNFPKEQYRQMIVCPGFVMKASADNTDEQMKKLHFILGHELGHDNHYAFFPNQYREILACKGYGNLPKYKKNEISADLIGIETSATYLESIKEPEADMSLVEKIKGAFQNKPIPISNTQKAQSDILLHSLEELCLSVDSKDSANEVHLPGGTRIEMVLRDPTMRKIFGCENKPGSCSLRQKISTAAQ